jgi:hypothetical protein
MTARSRSIPTTAYFVVLLLLLVIAVLLPFALASVVADVADQSATIYRIEPVPPAGNQSRADIHLQVVALNEWDGTASIRVTVHESCEDECPTGLRVEIVSAFGDSDDEQLDRPASVMVTLPANQRTTVQDVKLPLYGDPIRYPFDEYELGLGVILHRILPDGSVQRLTTAEGQALAGITLQARIPRAVLNDPQSLNPTRLGPEDAGDPFVVIEYLTFSRPLYLKVLTILLVLLVTAAAAYAVFLRPLDQLIVNSGALVLGVWGVRAVLLGTGLPGLTAVDLSLAVVILFLLVTITVRTLYLLEEDTRLRILRRWFARRTDPPKPAAPAGNRPPDIIPQPAGASVQSNGLVPSQAETEPADRQRT